MHDQVNGCQDAEDLDANGNVKHARLWHELAQRMQGEFMSLGFLAFIIFLLNQMGFFEILSNHFNDEASSAERFHYPVTELDWLHVAEVVHVKLFVGMLLYFALISQL